MAVKVDVLRPDDLLNLQIEGDNLRLDPSNPEEPALVLEDSNRPGHLVITFPPQTIVEQAYYESSPTKPPKGQENEPYNKTLPAPSAPSVPAKARLGGASRLVFRIPAGSTDRIPYTIEGLLNWESLELRVSPLADIPPSPTPAQTQAAPDIQKPSPLETAIELPYRLYLSPNHSVVWRHSLKAKTVQGVTELWHTRMLLRTADGTVYELSRLRPAPLRAIWSPDYSPTKFLASDAPLFQKPDADWGVLTPMTPSDRHEIVALTSGFHGYVKDLDDFTPYQPEPVYAEKLMLSPLGGWLKSKGEWDPPATFRLFPIILRPNGKKWSRYLQDFTQLQDVQIVRRGARPAVSPAAGLGAVPLSAAPQAAGAVPESQPAAGALHAPSDALAGSQISEASKVAVAGLGSILWPRLFGETGSLLNISEWSHIATQGRDHYVRIVYEGHLYPFGHRASLIKVSERKIRDVKLVDGSTTPLAYMVQRMFIVVRQPLRDYTLSEVKNKLEKGGRALPFKNIRLTTLVTPDIARPEDGSQITNTLYSFWVRLGIGASSDDDFKFHAIAEDFEGNRINFTTSLIFIPFSEDRRGNVPGVYNNSGDERACIVPGQKVSYAPPAGGAANENTSLTTTAVYFETHAAPVNKKFGGFLPKLFMAKVNLPAVEAMLGKAAATQIAYADPYLNDDPSNTTGLFAKVVKEVSSGVLQAEKLLSEFTADKAGGFATPNLSIAGLTRQAGPLAGNLANMAQDIFNPADFFNDVKDAAKLFGTLPLADLLKPLTMTAGAPKVQFNKEDLGAPPPAVKWRLVTTLDWTPEVKKIDVGIVTFHPKKKNVDAKLEVHGRVEKIVELPPTNNPDPGHAKMEGSLTNFTIELLHVVEVLFDRFAFASETGKKLDVSVALDSETPVRFIEDLQFVEELRKTIPPGLFGDGPSLDINPSRVKAGFSLGLPPVAVGVFSLREVTISAFLELPFLDGRPLFDFSFSSREHPFNLTVMIFGGGGFFHLQIDTLGVKMLEAALEFGASASIDLGVASGGVHIMAGIYFSMQRRTIDGKDVDAATLEGYLRMGGELSVLGLISVSLEFYLCFAYEFQKNAAYGRATLTVKVEVLFFSTSVEITVEKRFGGSSGDPTFLEAFDTPAIWDTYAGAFA